MSKLTINRFSKTWWVLLLANSSIVVALSHFSRTVSYNTVRKVLIALYSLLVIFLVIYKMKLVTDPEYETSFFAEIPLQLCNITSFLGLVGLISESRTVIGFCYVVGCIGPSLALCMPENAFRGIKFFDYKAIGYYGTHFALVALSVSLVGCNIYYPQYSDIPHVILFLFQLSFVIHIINTVLRKTGISKDVNYFYTYGLDENPILKKLKDIIKLNYVYEWPLFAVVALLAVIQIFITHLVMPSV